MFYDRIHNTSSLLRISEQVFRKGEICEIHKLYSHPNIAQYLGFQVQNRQITGICYRKEIDILMQRVSPKSRMKQKFKYNNQFLKNGNSCLYGVEMGIRHLRSLSLVHNDINPSNVLIDEDIDEYTSVTIDLDSCRPVGEGLERVGQTFELYDESIQLSLLSNDWMDCTRFESGWVIMASKISNSRIDRKDRKSKSHPVCLYWKRS